MKKMGIELPSKKLPKLREDKVKPKCKPVPLNKVGEYCKGEDGNTTLPV